jgi:predicted ATPase
MTNKKTWYDSPEVDALLEEAANDKSPKITLKTPEDIEALRERLKLETELESHKKILYELTPIMREIFWIARCWNDHNFSYNDLLEKCKFITDTLVGIASNARDLDACNEWLDKANSIGIHQHDHLPK